MSSRRIFRTTDAIADLDAIWDYIARDNPTAADHLMDELTERFSLLLNNPEIGERQILLADGSYRRSTCRNYVVYYRPLTEGIVIVRVLHGARDHERLL
jgi:toxin ParE1/3/4